MWGVGVYLGGVCMSMCCVSFTCALFPQEDISQYSHQQFDLSSKSRYEFALKKRQTDMQMDKHGNSYVSPET